MQYDAQAFFDNDKHLLYKNGVVFQYYQLPDLLDYAPLVDVLVEFLSAEKSIAEDNEYAVRYMIHNQDIRHTTEYEFLGHFDTIENKQVFVIDSFEEVPFDEEEEEMPEEQANGS